MTINSINMNDYANKKEVTFPSSDPTCHLSGDLNISPSDDETTLLPAIVIVAGSGPIDRHGNVLHPLAGMDFNTSNRFAEHMTSPDRHAIAILSYDKRGIGKSKNVDDKNFYYRAGAIDFVADAVEAVRFLSKHPRIDKTKIVLLGHSEGAIILPLICHEVSNKGLDPIRGCIFYSGFGENLVDAMAHQRETLVNEVQGMSGPTGWLLRKLVTKEKLETQYNDYLKKVNSPDEPEFISTQCGLVKQPTKWLREHIAYDAHDSLAKYISCHCLAITGQKDFQVRSEFCEPGRAAKLVPNAKSIEAHQLANLTHVLRSMEGPAKIMNLKKDYPKLGKLPLDEELLLITDAWCDRVLFDDDKE